MLPNKAHRVVEVYQQHGLIALSRRSSSWLLWKIKYLLFSNNTAEVTISGIPAEFITKTRKENSRFSDLMGEKEIIQDVITELDTEDVFYDVGANVGMFSCFAGKMVGNGGVIGFEPHPANASRLRENLELNGINAIVREEALSDKSAEVELQIMESGEAGVGTHSISTDSDSDRRTIKVPTARGDEIEHPNGKPTVLKIDVEGAEMQVLRGFENILRDSCRLIYCEVHPDKLPEFDATAEDVEQFLEEHGFEIEHLSEFSEEGTGYMLKCRNTNLK